MDLFLFHEEDTGGVGGGVLDGLLSAVRGDIVLRHPWEGSGERPSESGEEVVCGVHACVSLCVYTVCVCVYVSLYVWYTCMCVVVCVYRVYVYVSLYVCGGGVCVSL